MMNVFHRSGCSAWVLTETPAVLDGVWSDKDQSSAKKSESTHFIS